MERSAGLEMNPIRLRNDRPHAFTGRGSVELIETGELAVSFIYFVLSRVW